MIMKVRREEGREPLVSQHRRLPAPPGPTPSGQRGFPGNEVVARHSGRPRELAHKEPGGCHTGGESEPTCVSGLNIFSSGSAVPEPGPCALFLDPGLQGWVHESSVVRAKDPRLCLQVTGWPPRPPPPVTKSPLMPPCRELSAGWSAALPFIL